MLHLNINTKKRLIDFTILQLLQRNIQLGSLEKFSLLTSTWFIYGVRYNFTIIDLSISILYIRKVLFLFECIIFRRHHILFVSEHTCMEEIIKLIKGCGEQCLLGKWVAGLLTNFKHLWTVYQLLRKIEDKHLIRRRLKLKHILHGVYYISSIPSVIFISNIKKNILPSKEAYILKLPISCLLDTDTLPTNVLYPIPSNDDSLACVIFYKQLFVKSIFITKLELLLKIYKYKLILSK